MAKNTGKSFRRGSVKNRSQTYNPRNERWIKRDETTGRFVALKRDGEPFKGVRMDEPARILPFPASLSRRASQTRRAADFFPAA